MTPHSRPRNEEWNEEWDEETTDPCPYCGRMIHEDSERCPYCGSYISEEDMPGTSKPLWIILAAILCLAAAVMWFFCGP